jgi:hypothetical protein
MKLSLAMTTLVPLAAVLAGCVDEPQRNPGKNPPELIQQRGAGNSGGNGSGGGSGSEGRGTEGSEAERKEKEIAACNAATTTRWDTSSERCVEITDTRGSSGTGSTADTGSTGSKSSTAEEECRRRGTSYTWDISTGECYNRSGTSQTSYSRESECRARGSLYYWDSSTEECSRRDETSQTEAPTLSMAKLISQQVTFLAPTAGGTNCYIPLNTTLILTRNTQKQASNNEAQYVVQLEGAQGADCKAGEWRLILKHFKDASNY